MLPKRLDINQESWRWLLDKRWKGMVSLQNDSAIGAIDPHWQPKQRGWPSSKT
ncbi:hypothetical protein KUC_1468 [Vreelandella boliviensis LC1]|nr:hypothetical protein KUC_1468 [Halomonas boliviensis LC1]